MDIEFAGLKELSPNVVAALIGAAVTLLAALINLRIAWRREVLARMPAQRGGKARRGLLPAIGFLVAAAAVGGYALALYLMQARESETALLRAELRQRADQMQSSAERIEGARTLERQAAQAEAALAEERRRGVEGVAAAARLAPCRTRGDATHCREEDAPRTAVCAALPAKAVASELTVFAVLGNTDGSAVAYAPSALGADLGSARIAAKPFERSDGSKKQLCLEAWSWDSTRTLDLRIVTKYLVSEPAAPQGAASSSSTAQTREQSVASAR